MFVCEKILCKDFTGITMKEAYLKCCKWFSTNVLAKNNSYNILHHIEKLRASNGQSKCPTVRLTLYVYADEVAIKEKHCEICQEVSGAFYMAKNKHMCESCKLLPYHRRVEDKMESLVSAMKGVINE